MRLCIVGAVLLGLSWAEEVKEAKEAEEETTTEESRLPPCVHVDPYKDLEAWSKVDSTDCNTTSPWLEEIEGQWKKTLEERTGSTAGPDPIEEYTLTDEEKEKRLWGIKKFSFDALVSEKIGPHRDPPETAHELRASTSFAELFRCRNQTYEVSLKASIVVIYHNEALSVLLRMIDGIFRKTPENLLKEIVLYDDSSAEDLLISDYIKKYSKIVGWPEEKFVYERSDERQGLIRAKVFASRLATGDVLIFLDSHCEVTDRWIEPLLQPIEEDPKTIVLPVVDTINPSTFNYSMAMVAIAGFDWSLNFKWLYLPWQYFREDPLNNVRPIKSPAMSGGLLAIRRDYFKELGEYDEGMLIWGGENVELSLRTWRCGGRILVAPCSRVGHVFRMRRPYGDLPHIDTNIHNQLRLARVWLDGHYIEKFLNVRQSARKMDAGDLKSRLDLKRRLKCKDMKWYIENVYPDLDPKDEDGSIIKRAQEKQATKRKNKQAEAIKKAQEKQNAERRAAEGITEAAQDAEATIEKPPKAHKEEL